MRTVVSLDDHTEAVLTLLRSTTITVGDGEAPRGPNKEEIKPPYAVLYPLVGGEFDGPISDNQVDVVLNYQITAVGKTRSSAQIVQDILRGVMQRESLVIPGRVVRDIRLLNPNTGIVRDDDLPNPLFYGYDRYEVDTTPS